MKFLPLLLKNVLRKKTRTLLTIGSIVLPLLVICLMGTFLKALEAPDPRTTRGSFRLLGESMLIALAGGAAGILVFVAGEPALRRQLLQSPMSGLAATFHLYPQVLALAFGLAVGIGILSGLVPALRSATRSIADGLRQVA